MAIITSPSGAEAHSHRTCKNRTLCGDVYKQRQPRQYQIAIRDLHLKDWIMFERHVHPAIYDKIFAIITTMNKFTVPASTS